VIVTNAPLLTAVQAQPAAAVTVAEPVPPSAPKAVVAGCPTLKEQVGVGVGAAGVESLLQAAVVSATAPQTIVVSKARRQAFISGSLKTSGNSRPPCGGRLDRGTIG
jgi:hypothetical protein